MNYSRPVQLALAGVLACPLLATAQTPGHQHYQKPPAYEQAPAPGMPLAPRLQNLGVHTFRVTTTSDRAQLFIKGLHRASMRKALLAALEARPELRRRTTVDVDPMSVL